MLSVTTETTSTKQVIDRLISATNRVLLVESSGSVQSRVVIVAEDAFVLSISQRCPLKLSGQLSENGKGLTSLALVFVYIKNITCSWWAQRRRKYNAHRSNRIRSRLDRNPGRRAMLRWPSLAHRSLLLWFRCVASRRSWTGSLSARVGIWPQPWACANIDEGQWATRSGTWCPWVTSRGSLSPNPSSKCNPHRSVDKQNKRNYYYFFKIMDETWDYSRPTAKP